MNHIANQSGTLFFALSLLTSSFILRTSLCLVAVLSTGTGIAIGQNATPVSLAPNFEVTQLADHVWMHTSWQELEPYGRFPSHGLVVVDRDEALLIDTAWGDSLTALLVEWLESGLGVRVVGAVVTHSHDDRMGGISTLRKSGIPSYSLIQTQELATAQGLAGPDSTLSVSDALIVGDMLVETYFPGPGHTPDNLAVWIARGNFLFGGCMIRPAGSSSPGNTADAVLDEWPRSVARLRDRFADARVVVPSHGPPGGPELLAHTIEVVDRARLDRLTSDPHQPADTMALTSKTIFGEVQVNGTTLTYDVTGEGHPLVLLHGGFMDRRMWDDQLPTFSPDYKVIRVNLRGFEGQPIPDARFSFVDDLYAFLTQLDLGPVYVLGLSLGAMVATEFTLNHPEMVDALVLAGAPLRGLDTPDTEGSMQKVNAAIGAYRRGAVDSAMTLLFDLAVFNPANPDPAVRKRMDRMVRDNFDHWLRAMQLIDWDAVPPVDRIDRITAPTLIVVGDRDYEAILIASDSLASRIPGARRVVIEGASHHINMEEPEDFNAAVLSFLGKLE